MKSKSFIILAIVGFSFLMSCESKSVELPQTENEAEIDSIATQAVEEAMFKADSVLKSK